jgi:hypothetical protein
MLSTFRETFMAGTALSAFREIVAVDTEFEAGIGERPVPVCLVAKELRSGRTFRIFQGEFPDRPPYATGTDVLFVAIYASAEFGTYRALPSPWPMPERILDLFAEFRDRTNGLPTPCGSGELGMLVYFGLDHMDAVEKKYMQETIGSGRWRGVLTPKQILDYCERDVRARGYAGGLSIRRSLFGIWKAGRINSRRRHQGLAQVRARTV